MRKRARKTFRAGKRTFRALTNQLRRRYLRLQRDLRLAYKLKAMLGTPLRADLRTLRTWRGEAPRIALRNYFNHPIWSTYRTHPPLRYAPSPLAELDHWIDVLPEQLGGIPSNRRARRRARRPHVLEVEHWSNLLAWPKFDAGLWANVWSRALAERWRIDDRVRADECRAVLTLSPGLVEHFRDFLAPDVWPKLDYAFPAFPSQPAAERSYGETFTVLTIGNRFSDKGIPEALGAFEVLRARHGPHVRMVLVSSGVPRGWSLPEGVALCGAARMSAELKASIYRSADVLLVPAYSETVGNYTEACAFGLPTVATRIHHGDAFVREGESGYLIDSPVIAYCDELGTRWKGWTDFWAEIERMRESGQLAGVVQDLVDRLELMLSGDVDLDELRRGARRLHAECFSPEARNQRLNAVYARALGA